jgi:hypothetical protein
MSLLPPSPPSSEYATPLTKSQFFVKYFSRVISFIPISGAKVEPNDEFDHDVLRCCRRVCVINDKIRDQNRSLGFEDSNVIQESMLARLNSS